LPDVEDIHAAEFVVGGVRPDENAVGLS